MTDMIEQMKLLGLPAILSLLTEPPKPEHISMKTKTTNRILLLTLAVGLTTGSTYAAEHEHGDGKKVAGEARSGMSAEQAVEKWKDEPKKVAKTIIEKYGQPDEVTSERLIWHNNGPWLKTELVNEEIPHKFPVPHHDMLKQTVAMLVPAEKFSDLAAYDGSVIVERTKGTLSARCDKESMNFLAVNLAKDVVEGKKSVEEARDAYASIAMKAMKGESDPYIEGLQFDVAKAPVGDPDQPTKKSE